jgi:hypothetical protein
MRGLRKARVGSLIRGIGKTLREQFMDTKNVLKLIVGGLVLFVSGLVAPPAHAGLVWFSRANCVNNESISWDWPLRSYWLWTDSYHHKDGWEPVLRTGWEYGFRSAAVHWGEGLSGGWHVVGEHYQWVSGRGTIHLGRSQADNCNAGAAWPTAVEGDRARIVGAGDMPLPLPPGEAERAARIAASLADDGFSAKEYSPEAVRQFFNSVDFVKAGLGNQRGANEDPLADSPGPGILKDFGDLRLSFAPAVVSRGALIGAVACATLVDGRWTGLERYYRIDGAGFLRLTENDLNATGGMFHMFKDAINTTVGAKPAISVVFTDGEGRSVEEVMWVDLGKLYTLTYGPDVRPGPRGKEKRDPHVSAAGLAQELR